jgi:hypothetical protein
VDAIIDYSKPLPKDSGIESSTNTCIYPRDGVCDDPRGTKYSELGTDCQDCGPVGADNFTRSDDDGWWDDDDYWTFNDENFLPKNTTTVFKRKDSAGPAAMFFVMSKGIVYTVGAIFAAAALYLLNRWYQGQIMPFLNAFTPDLNQKEFDKTPLTPHEDDLAKRSVLPIVYCSGSGLSSDACGGGGGLV